MDLANHISYEHMNLQFIPGLVHNGPSKDNWLIDLEAEICVILVMPVSGNYFER